MAETIHIQTSEIAITDDNKKIETGGIGSCIVIVLWDKETKIGGMAHCMLPKRRKPTKNDYKQEKSARYVDEALDLLMEGIEKKGGNKNNLIAKIVGGAKMFKHLGGDDKGIGYQNTEAAREKLEERGILLQSEAVGGSIGRVATFNPQNGILNVQVRM